MCSCRRKYIITRKDKTSCFPLDGRCPDLNMFSIQQRTFSLTKARIFVAKLHKLSERYVSLSSSNLFSTKGVTTTSFPEFEKDNTLDIHQNLYDFSINSSETFWATLARSRLKWSKEFSQVSDCNINEGKIRWFMDGQLNASGMLESSGVWKFNPLAAAK
ncbi:ACSS1_2 [Mytilus coruscus]|uniref:ACSS1_2 n=1 Tax=Mytilus coruscus TaxID=42192 RepID=A0A6J8AC85_MYTCO|nr:ACSS1_2 [Mytilus coruscus]